MELYGAQIGPLLQAVIEDGGVQNIHPEGGFFHRAVYRAILSRWAG
jgi:hypothetical protein